MTPGVNWSSVLKLRPLSGSVSTNLRLMTVPTAALSVLTSGAPASIVKLSNTAPTGKVKLMDSAS